MWRSKLARCLSKFTAGITSKRGKFRLRQGKRENKQMEIATELSKREAQSPFPPLPFPQLPAEDGRFYDPF